TTARTPFDATQKQVLSAARHPCCPERRAQRRARLVGFCPALALPDAPSPCALSFCNVAPGDAFAYIRGRFPIPGAGPDRRHKPVSCAGRFHGWSSSRFKTLERTCPMARQFIYHMSGLSKAYGAKKVLDNVHLSFYPDAKIGILGPNGAGKSRSEGTRLNSSHV